MMDFKRGTVGLLLSVCLVTGIEANTPHGRMAIADPQQSLLQKAQLIGPVKSDTEMQLFVQLKLRNREQLEQLVKDLYDAHSPKYQHFLTSDEFKAEYAPNTNSLNAVKDYFTSIGMKAQVLGNGVQVLGTARQVEQAVGTQLNKYHYQQRTVYANATVPMLPAAIASFVSDIQGLNNFIDYNQAIDKHLQQTLKDEAHKANEMRSSSKSQRSSLAPTNNSLNGLTGTQLRTAYNLAAIPAVNNMTIDGTGQIIGIVQACDTSYLNSQIQIDANEFSAANGLPPVQITIINVGGWVACSSASTSHYALPIAQAIQGQHAMAPNARIILYLGSTDTTAAYLAAESKAVTDNTAAVISNGWGGTADSTVPGPYDATFLQAMAQGQSVNFQSGNNAGSPVTYPGDNTYITSVGGSSLFVGSDGSYSFESGWGYGVTFSGIYIGGTTGGISSNFPALSAQANAIQNFSIGSLGTINQYSCQGQICRAVPDIAMLADQNTGLIIYGTIPCLQFYPYNLPSPCSTGSTSLAVQLFSGTLTLVNQVRQLNGLSRLGLATPYLYANNLTLLQTQSLNVITPPHMLAPGWIVGYTAPGYDFQINAFQAASPSQPTEYAPFNYLYTNGGQAMEENQFWNDVVGVGSPNIPNFVSTMGTL
ncbi:S53 family peptidase [Legionella sp.]|uniref:S53 family peptidase n=1 Tax=Legionella sp. TaxID=459 RepID=UPI003CB93021